MGANVLKGIKRDEEGTGCELEGCKYYVACIASGLFFFFFEK